MVVAEKLDLELISPDERILVTAPEFMRQRRVRIDRMAALDPAAFPAFVKPVIPKQFRASVYDSVAVLQRECVGLGPETEVLVSEIVRFRAEARAFALDSIIQTVSLYEGVANVDDAAKFAERVVQALELPKTCVIDVGLLDSGAWAFIEANATWGAGLNGCDPVEAARCIAAATHVRKR